MAWITPHTLNAEDTWTHTDWNTYVRDNLNATITGTVANALEYCVSDAAHSLAIRTAGDATVATSQTTTSTSYADLTTVGPSVTKTTGTAAMVWFSCKMSNNTDSTQCMASVAVSSATTIAADDDWMMMQDGVTNSNTNRFGMFKLFDTLTAGSNIFTMKYKVGGGTGTFVDRHIIVLPL
jgi:hypothetical protein